MENPNARIACSPSPNHAESCKEQRGRRDGGAHNALVMTTGIVVLGVVSALAIVALTLRSGVRFTDNRNNAGVIHSGDEFDIRSRVETQGSNSTDTK